MHMPGMLSQAQLRQLMATTGQNFDLLFLEMMSAHHQGAIEMANSELRDGSRPEVKRLAQQIIDDQQAEIDQSSSGSRSGRRRSADRPPRAPSRGRAVGGENAAGQTGHRGP
jgi:predicted outer membrane protein